MSDNFLGDRLTYGRSGLEKSSLHEDPLAQLRAWLADAQSASVLEPSAMALSTVSPTGRPSTRMVLLRSIDSGLVFFTNYTSQKGRDLDETPWASVAFWWPSLERQVRVEGRVQRVSEQESTDYFRSRPRDSQLASAASPQSTIIDSREELEQAMSNLDAQYPGEIPKPNDWGGFRLVPDRFEFWQGRPARLHDRFAYLPVEGGWQIVRLAP